MSPNDVLANDASVIDEKVREEIKELLRKRLDVPEVEEEEPPEEPESEVLIPIKTIRLEGNTLISTEELNPLIVPYEDKEHTLAALKKLADAIEDVYRSRGYITTQVFIPPQRVEESVLLIRVVEGKVGDFYVEDNQYFSEPLILSYIDVEPGEVLHYDELRRSLRILNENPDREVRAVLRKGKDPETTDIVLKVKDQNPLHLQFMADNQGTDATGKERFGFIGRHNNLLGQDDILAAGVIFGSDFGSVFSQYIYTLPKTQTRLMGGISYAQVAPKGDFSSLGVNGTSETYYGKIEQRILEKSNLFMDFSAAFELKEARTKILSGTFKRERLRILRFGPSVLVRDPWGGVNKINNEYAFGLDTWGAAYHIDPSGSRPTVDETFFKVSGSIQRVQRLGGGLVTKLDTELQFAANPLPSSEGLSLGGLNSVRGYPEGDYIGDSGLRMSLEVVVPSFFLPPDWKFPFTDSSLQEKLKWVPFIDHGVGRIRNPTSREIRSRYLAGTGIGLQWEVNENLYVRTDWAFAVGDHPLTDSGRFRFHYRLQYEF